jgi:molybdopterin-binding protein
MLLPVPYNFPGKVKQITTTGHSSEVTLTFEDTSLEISVFITMEKIADLALKKGTPVYAAIIRREGAIPPGSEKSVVTVKHQDGDWVTIGRGSDPAALIAAARKKEKNPTKAQMDAWDNGYLYLDDYNGKVNDVWMRKEKCEFEKCPYQIEAFIHHNGLWETIPYCTDCNAKIWNARDKYAHDGKQPTGDLEAWNHGYASFAAYKAAFGAKNSFSVFSPFLAGFVYNGDTGTPDLFTAPGLTANENLWPVPLNIYRDLKQVGRSVVTEITL